RTADVRGYGEARAPAERARLMPTFDELRASAETSWTAIDAPSRPLFLVSLCTSSIAGGAASTFEALRKLSESGAAFDVMRTGDTGLAWAEPVVQVRKPGGDTVLYGHVTPDKAEAFATEAAAGIAKEYAVAVVSGTVADVPALADLDWMK